MGYLDQLKEEYATQNNRATAYPLYVTVQELQFVCIFDDSYGHYHDGVIKCKYNYEDSDSDWFDSKDECIEHIKEYSDREHWDSIIESIDEFICLYLWIDIEVFLTIDGAAEFMNINSHNLGETRTYVKHFNHKNYEMRKMLQEVGFKTEG